MKIASVELNDTGRMYLRHPATQEDLYTATGDQMFIDLYGAHTETYKRLTRQWQNEALRNRKLKTTAEQLEQRATELLSAVTAGWNLEDENDKPVPFSVENARAIYGGKDSAWVRAQADEFVHETANFVGESFAA